MGMEWQIERKWQGDRMSEEKRGTPDPAASNSEQQQSAADKVQPDTLEPGEDFCPKCGGTGHPDNSDPCPTCEGRGVVLKGIDGG